MERDCEQEENLSELLHFLDDEAEGSSNDIDNGREPELEPKHKIFLSHSGFQKDFTEQLCVDLERWHYYPFFDKRPDSLPKGRKFPELIFQAAQQCQVLILILSEDFFTRTKWPMLELEAFVEAQKKNPQKVSILPVFLGLSRYECTKDEAKRLNWLSAWKGWAQNDKKINVNKWEAALKVLNSSNGIEYVKSVGEVTLRGQIVSAVRRLVKPEKTWSDVAVQGRKKICKAILENFVKTKPSPLYGVRVVGIYGMGGIGKSTFCKVLCDELYMKFEGKVCHAELGSKSQVELQKEVLRQLTDTSYDSLMFETGEMTTNLLRKRIHRQQVFLALDNVWQESLEEAKVYLRTGFRRHSIVLVTARSIDILGFLNIDRSDCLEMPDLEEEDARRLFLHHAGPGVQFKMEEDGHKIQYCIKQCQFQKGENMGEHFHPLALKVLGGQLGSLGHDPNIWVDNLSKEDKFNQFRLNEHPIFDILRRGYDYLQKEDQLLFMDGVLFHPSQRYSLIFDQGNFVTTGARHIFRIDMYEWLSIIHNVEVKVIKDRLQGLKARSLFEDIGDAFLGVSVHDLYLDFAKMEAKRGALGSRRWVWYDREAAFPTDLTEVPHGQCWADIKRVYVKYNRYPKYYHYARVDDRWKGTVGGLQWQHFSNVVVLDLLVGWDGVLDLRGLQCLRSLELNWVDAKDRKGGGGKLVGLGEMRNLGWLALGDIHYTLCFEEIGHLTNLQVLRLRSCSWPCDKGPLSLPVLDNCIRLRELVLECACLEAFPNMSKLTSLRKVIFYNCCSARELVGLSSQMCGIQELLLISSSSLSNCPGLGDLVSLRELDVVGCSNLRQLADLRKLTNLRRLNITKANQALGFSDAMQLQELFVAWVAELPGLYRLRHLQRLSIGCIEHVMPRFGSFIELEELILGNLSEAHALPDMHKLTRLRRLTINYAPHLSQLPELGGLEALQYLNLTHCCTEVGIAKLPGLHKLTNLQSVELNFVPITSLPSLERLTQLVDIRCSFTLLEELPDLSGSKNLERIDLSGCHELKSLGNLATMPALEYLNVTTCYKLERLPNLRSSQRLHYLSLCHSGVRLCTNDITILASLLTSHVFAWDHVHLDFPEMLEKMTFTELVEEMGAKQSAYFATPQLTTWHFTHTCMHDMSVSAVASISLR